jgi:hypothetical protein
MTQRIAVLLTLLLSGLMHAQINPTASIELIPDVEQAQIKKEKKKERKK